MPTFRPVNPDDRLIYELMPILIGIGPNADLLCYGSCFIAWPHMAITGKHVIEELLRNDPGIALGKPCKFEYWIIQIKWVGDEHSYVVWTVDSIGTSPHTDIAIIWLRAHDQNATQHKKWGIIPVNFDVPPIGSTVTAFGLHDVRFDGSRVNADGKFEHIEVNFERSQSTGIVKQIYWEGRDRGLYSFPCFEIDARFEHGMSGGLVITENSQVCGIVCGSLATTSIDEAHVSYVTMLWPMMAIPVDARLVPGGAEPARYRLKDLSAQGIFAPNGWDRVQIEDTLDAGGPLTLRYLRKHFGKLYGDSIEGFS